MPNFVRKISRLFVKEYQKKIITYMMYDAELYTALKQRTGIL